MNQNTFYLNVQPHPHPQRFGRMKKAIEFITLDLFFRIKADKGHGLVYKPCMRFVASHNNNQAIAGPLMLSARDNLCNCSSNYSPYFIKHQLQKLTLSFIFQLTCGRKVNLLRAIISSLSNTIDHKNNQ